MYVYIKHGNNEYTTYHVGFYDPFGGAFVEESRYTSTRDAAARCNYLNGGTGTPIAAQ
jgi:hypothetical protein